MTEIEFMKKLRSEAAKDLDRVKTLVRILPFEYLQWLDSRAAALDDTISQYDEFLSRPGSVIDRR